MSGQATQNPPVTVRCDDLMTPEQAFQLKQLAEQAHSPESFDPELSSAEAVERITALRAIICLSVGVSSSKSVARDWRVGP